jgi:hypothetical protein
MANPFGGTGAGRPGTLFYQLAEAGDDCRVVADAAPQVIDAFAGLEVERLDPHRYENGHAEGTLECGGLTPPSPFGLYAGATLRRRQASALQGASRVFMRGFEPKDHGVCAENRVRFEFVFHSKKR